MMKTPTPVKPTKIRPTPPRRNFFATVCRYAASQRGVKDVSSIFLAVLLVLGGSLPIEAKSTQAPSGLYGQVGPHQVQTLSEVWRDEFREREVPVKVYYPVGVKAAPMVLFSHGLGGSREGYRYLGEHWASHGFVSVHLQHAGSDEAVWKNAPWGKRKAAMMEAVRDLNAAIDRPDDITFVLTRLVDLSQDTKHRLSGVVDPKNAAVAGHSFGAFTVLAVAGQQFETPEGPFSFYDKRLKAAVAMSPNKLRQRQDFEGAYAEIALPLFHLTGTLDTSPITPTVKAKDRTEPYQRIPHPEQHLLVLKGGDHSVFAGQRWRKGPGDAAKDPRFQALIKSSTTAFWKAYLQQDQRALAWLADGGFARELGEDGTYQNKRGKTTAAK